MIRKSVVMAAVVLAAACDAGGPRLAPVSFQMIRADGSGAAAAGLLANLSGETGVVPPSAVASLTVQVNRVEALPRGGDEDSEHGWVSVDVSANGALDLMALPTDPAGGIVLAAGTVPVGTYAKVRLFFTEAAVTFNTDVTVGSQTFAAGVAHPVTFPSGAESGIKTQAGFEVADGGGAVTVAFDAETTFRHVGATGSGQINVPPVLR
ncbi:MAG: DUF4382 domain-containing protein [Gemmatimonadales bacterium]